MSKARGALKVTGKKGILEGMISPNANSGEGSSLSTSSRVEDILLSKIYRPSQPRKFFNPDEIEKLKQTIEQNGFQGQILLTPLPDEHPERDNGFEYELIYGASRCRAVEGLGRLTIPAEVKKGLTRSEIRRIRLDENLIRAGLNPLEEAEGLIDIMADEAGVNPADVERDLNSASNTRKRKTEVSSEVAERLEKYQDILDHYKKGKLSSFRIQLIRFRSLPHDVKKAVEEGSIDASKALELGSIKENAVREELLNWVIDENPPVKQIREEKRNRARGEKKRKDSPLRARLEKSFIKLKSSAVLDSPDSAKKEKVEQIERLIKELLEGESAT